MKRTLIAAAVLSTMATGSAYAQCTGCDRAELFTATNIVTDIGEFGFITLRGGVDVASSSGATVNNTQVADIGGVDMKTPPQSYTTGTVTTTTDATRSWFNGSGGGSNYAVHSSYSAGAFAEGSQEQSAAAYAQGQSFGESSGFNQGTQGSYSGGSYVNTHNSANGYLAAGFIAGIGGGHGVIFGGVAAGFAAALNTHSSDNYGGYFAEQSSGHQAAWGQEHSSGYFAQAAEQSASGYYQSGHVSADANAWGWSAHDNISEGSVNVYGSITQHINTETPTTMTASIGNGALAGAQGNIGVNMATGVDNAQSNDAALANMDVGPVFGSAQIYSTQSSTGKGKVGDFNFVASVGSGVLAGATGNIGVNVASGLGNVQNNSLAVSATTDSSDRDSRRDGGEVIASDQNCQTADAVVSGGFTGSAMLGAGALAGATGNIGVNIASGVGNLQHNGLAVASVSH
ncbi:hypothetical protein PQR34_42170 [Paraburkholderia sediminicola]|uniref:hypothetical protein n=1 Tax=Paraburkholderia sediminicola TaxID=458836 RepID=UPI0038BB0564